MCQETGPNDPKDKIYSRKKSKVYLAVRVIEHGF